MIRALPLEARSALRSGLAASCPAQCVEELLLNSLDAQASCVAVRVDMERLRLQVVDNGAGMSREDVEQAGRRYFTSKGRAPRLYGFRGEFLASLADAAGLLEISSRGRAAPHTFAKLFLKGRAHALRQAPDARPSAGTTVTVCDLFYNLPVRRGRVRGALEVERARRRLEAVALLHPGVSFSLRDDASARLLLRLPKARDGCARFAQLYGPSRSRGLRPLRFSRRGFDVRGHVSAEAHSSRSLQFLYVNGRRLLLRTKVHRLIDFLLQKESAICKRAAAQLHGVYVLNVTGLHSESEYELGFRNWDGVLHCVEEGVRRFLNREHLRVEPSSEDVKEFQDRNGFRLFSTEKLQPGPEPCADVRENYELSRFSSKAAKRNTESGNPDGEDGGNQETPICLQQGVDDLSSPVTCGQAVGHHNAQTPLLIEDSEAEGMTLKCNQPTDSTGILFSDCNLMAQESSMKRFHGAHEIRDETTSSEECDIRKKENEERKKDVDFVQMEPCFTDLRTHMMPNEVAEISEIQNDSLRLFSRLGPVSAQEIFGNEISVSAHTENVCLAGGLKKAANLQSSWKEKLTLKERKNQESFYISDQRGERDDSTQHCNDASLLNISDVLLAKNFTDRQAKTPKLVFSDPGKLSLVTHVGSLERFRRHYGKAKNSASSQDGNKKCNRVSSLALTEPECSGIWNNNFEPFSDCENTNVEPFGSKNSSLDTLDLDNSCNWSVEKCPNSKDDILLGNKITWLKRQSRIQSNYTVHQDKSANSPASLSLATKLTRMKGDHRKALIPEKTRHFVEESQANLSHKVNAACELLEANEAINQSQTLSVNSQTESHKLNYTAEIMRNFNSSNTANCDGEEHTKCSVFTAGEFANNSDIYPDLENIKVYSGGKYTNADMLNVSLKQEFQTSKFSDISLPCKLEDAPSEDAFQYINDGKSPTSCNWLHYFDVSLGRTVYVNRDTGLSSYSAPSKENQTVCTKDLTTLAVNVVSGNDDEAANGSLQSSFLEWENPVFARQSEVAVDVSSCLAQRLAVKIHNILYPYRFTKEMVHSMKVLKQVDNKFIACLISTKNEETAIPDGNLLVLVDQHAAHERIRLEQLITESYELQPDMSGRKKFFSSTMYPPLQIEVTEEERRLLRSYQRSLEELGLGVSFPEASIPSILVHSVPLCFVEREANEARRRRPAVTQSIVEEFIREQVELLQTAGGARGSFPPTVLKVLASQACHGAIKFNNSLSAEESCSLIEALSRCQLPFQCAHGRPSMLPLADTDHLQLNTQETSLPNLKRLRKMFNTWQLFKQ
uniref:DNA mismatch repair protein Mlh3 isoform X2 n=1 Tax=Geotrypetes seraphini TaxID=260995 RepID=A0A6P8RUA4_GEOSA|nr:DNA mismatch repair protein Mlh3 isoform X2 [Geotrypetes seraphini]